MAGGQAAEGIGLTANGIWHMEQIGLFHPPSSIRHLPTKPNILTSSHHPPSGHTSTVNPPRQNYHPFDGQGRRLFGHAAASGEQRRQQLLIQYRRRRRRPAASQLAAEQQQH
jgi:hypothetical protein